MKRVVITGVTGTLGSALAAHYEEKGWEVIGVSRHPEAKHEHCARMVGNAQRTNEDARALLAEDPDLVVLNAGQIESEIGADGLPLAESTQCIYEINALFPSLCALEAAGSAPERPLDVVAVGSIADGSPSSFGPVYHASKIALHYFFTAVAPIARQHDPKIRLRVYRPGAIRGPLSWAPAIRLNERGRKIRARRCESAPDASEVAHHMARWIEGDGIVGTYDEPLSFRVLKLLFVLAPNLYARLQHWGWSKGSRFA